MSARTSNAFSRLTLVIIATAGGLMSSTRAVVFATSHEDALGNSTAGRDPRAHTHRSGWSSPSIFSSNAQHDQLNKSDADQQHRKCHGIVFEPMPTIGKHHIHPFELTSSGDPDHAEPLARTGNRLVDRHVPHVRFRRISPRRFLVSRFAAKTWPAFRSLWRESGVADDPQVPRLTATTHEAAVTWLQNSSGLP
jgi:hypothetical protein